jgi:hypothetical protein
LLTIGTRVRDYLRFEIALSVVADMGILITIAGNIAPSRIGLTTNPRREGGQYAIDDLNNTFIVISHKKEFQYTRG